MKKGNDAKVEDKQRIIEIHLRLGTKLDDFVAEICWQAWELAGTQVDAAASLGMRPETLARKLKSRREGIARSKGEVESAK